MSRIRADRFVNSGANGAPQLTYGAEVVAGVGLTGAGGINITGIATAASFSGATGSFTGDVDIADKIIHTGDPNTAIRFPAVDTFTVETAGVERVRFNSSGKILVGSDTLRNITSSASSGILQIEGTAANTSSAALINNQNDAKSSVLYFAKTRGSATGAVTTVANGDKLGSIRFAGADGTDLQNGTAQIKAIVNGTVAGNQIPTDITFETSATNGSSIAERLRITSGGNVGINEINPTNPLVVKQSSANINLELHSTSSGRGTQIMTHNDHATFYHGLAGDTTGEYIYYTANAKDHVFSTNNTERLRIDSSGRLLVGASSSIDVASTGSAIMQVTQGAGGLSGAFYSTANALGPGGVIALGHGRNSTSGLLSSGDVMGQIRFAGADGTDMESSGAQISAEVDGTPGSNDMPGRLVFSTTADGASGVTERMRISSSGQTKLFHSTSNTQVLRPEANSSSYSSDVIQVNCVRSANAAYNLFKALSGNLSDVEFKLAGNGIGYSDGGWTTPASDYAEFFEWVDGNPDNEDRRGISVVLDANKIREAVAGEDPLGIISARPSIVGDAATEHWKEKHLTDEFGSYVMEPHNVVSWKDENGKEHNYEDWNIPSDVVVPNNAVIAAADENGVPFKHRKLNPDYDSNQDYISRADRIEWDTVGLLGKLRMRKGKPTGSRWIKMRDINDSVEEWLVR